MEKNVLCLVRELNERGEKAIETLFHMLYPALCYFAVKITDDREIARDIVQEVFARFYEKDNYRFDSMAGVRSFFYRAVYNEAIDWTRKNGRLVQLTGDYAQNETDDELHYAEQESRVFEKVFTAIEQLPEASRMIFVMSYIDRLSVSEISAKLGIAESTVKTQRQRAKKQLKEKLGAYGKLLTLLFF
ncbi:sigma-70 family RNA polymerase sigma factor [Alistipes sp. OttesenSCG-928-B03]|nr:sigma-70 family RNA polymerase sigma factor [Alistipes sp. OttesenSCG-928-B03]